MRTIKMLLTAALTCSAASGLHAPSLASQTAETATQIRERETNRLLLEALLKRRNEVAQTGTESSRAALEFIDRRIAELRSRAGN